MGKRERSERFPVRCLECGKRFMTASMVPECPKCGGSDIEPAEVFAAPRRELARVAAPWLGAGTAPAPEAAAALAPEVPLAFLHLDDWWAGRE